MTKKQQPLIRRTYLVIPSEAHRERPGMTPKQIEQLPGEGLTPEQLRRRLKRELAKEVARQAPIIAAAFDKVTPEEMDVEFDGAHITDEESEGYIIRADGSLGGYPKKKGKSGKAARRPAAPAIVSWEDQTLGKDVTWEHLVVLVGKLLRLRSRGRSRFLIVTRAHPHRFVQFDAGQSPGALRGEAISNHFLEGEVGRLRQLARARKVGREARSALLPRSLQTRGVLLSKAERAALRGLGWQEPTSRQPNFWRTWRRGVDPAQVANVAVSTLRGAFGISSPRGLEVICGSHPPAG